MAAFASVAVAALPNAAPAVAGQVSCSQRAIVKKNDAFLSKNNAFATFDGLKKNVTFAVSRGSGLQMAKGTVVFADEVSAADPFVATLSTPISDGYFKNNWISNLPAYREGLNPFRRALEIGMAHGYFLVGPFLTYGPHRNADDALLTGALAAGGMIVILTHGLALYGKVSFSGSAKEGDVFETGAGWNEFLAGWIIGGLGGVAFASLILDGIARSI
mmetsp:Transcript_10841/g.18995  ORF Transcript_10841/g.18995 Transcript_10841/m.18995 type:complete len:217 (-) Transcript_10841:672-1322(-)|eukprot:CAMPEP_0196652064 /NCGR_PEP_ID=MMETSP1086-20130531/1275_1 /TAXON_ID=77921 /ORGANISM="Cyanoptyche  gloeocystis , Strain SAG4.97" /LENGTH=216 /DNA_ID=CAMNT_0041982425 /DNA_START=78 /DNA_END=728 /DNA_ORIENTATION=-